MRCVASVLGVFYVLGEVQSQHRTIHFEKKVGRFSLIKVTKSMEAVRRDHVFTRGYVLVIC